VWCSKVSRSDWKAAGNSGSLVAASDSYTVGLS